MKKFLSLVLALIMTFSLVTIGAGATEYKDLTDKNEITYEEAVAVLNKLGIISGYSDGSFNPTGTLTRGAAAKIIVSLMIGPEAANNLAVNAAPYSDVPANHTFAGVISYCKTAGYINGYNDGTFRPADPLTGYAFSKMLLGALGYDGVQERFTGLGWTMNVNKLGNEAGLFRDFAEGFKGNDGVTREQACLLALNTLKATQVEYSGGTSITTSAGDATTSVVTNKVRSYKVSNDGKVNANISNKKTSLGGAEYATLEFAEERFPNLVLRDAVDDYGRPSNTWSLKNVKIGTYAKAADYTFTAAASGDTDADKVKDMGLNDYQVGGYASSSRKTALTVNGREYLAGAPVQVGSNSVTFASASSLEKTTEDDNAKILANYVKNGALVQVYLDEDYANVISHIAVTETQVMKVNRVNSKDVTLKAVENTGIKDDANGTAVAVDPVKSDDACYADLKDLKSDAVVVITPLANSKSGTTGYSVDKVFVPTTVEGKLSKVDLNKSGTATGVTLDSAGYKMSRNWTVEDGRSNLSKNSVSTVQTSKAYIDSYGYVIYMEKVVAQTDFIIFDEFYSNVVDGRIHYFAQGWDLKGNDLTLDMGTNSSVVSGKVSGNVYAYRLSTNNNTADYVWDSGKQTTHVHPDNTTTTPLYASSTNIGGTYWTSGVKFIFLTMAGDGTVDTVTVKNGSQKLSSGIAYEYVNNNKGDQIQAVVVHSDKDVEVSQNILYVEKVTGSTKNGEKTVSIVNGYANGEQLTGITLDKQAANDTFWTYSVDSATNVYKVNAYENKAEKTTSCVSGAWFNREALKSKAYLDAGLLYLATDSDGDPILSGEKLATNLAMNTATVFDLRTGGTLSSAKDMAEATANGSYKVSLIYNDQHEGNNQGRATYIFITDSDAADQGLAKTAAARYKVTANAGDTDHEVEFALSVNGPWKDVVEAAPGEIVYVRAKNLPASAVSAIKVNTNADVNVSFFARMSKALVQYAGEVTLKETSTEGVYSFKVADNVDGDVTIVIDTSNGIDAYLVESAKYVDTVGLVYTEKTLGSGAAPSDVFALAKLVADALEKNPGYSNVKAQGNGGVNFTRNDVPFTVPADEIIDMTTASTSGGGLEDGDLSEAIVTAPATVEIPEEREPVLDESGDETGEYETVEVETGVTANNVTDLGLNIGAGSANFNDHQTPGGEAATILKVTVKVNPEWFENDGSGMWAIADNPSLSKVMHGDVKPTALNRFLTWVQIDEDYSSGILEMELELVYVDGCGPITLSFYDTETAPADGAKPVQVVTINPSISFK